MRAPLLRSFARTQVRTRSSPPPKASSMAVRASSNALPTLEMLRNVNPFHHNNLRAPLQNVESLGTRSDEERARRTRRSEEETRVPCYRLKNCETVARKSGTEQLLPLLVKAV